MLQRNGPSLSLRLVPVTPALPFKPHVPTGTTRQLSTGFLGNSIQTTDFHHHHSQTKTGYLSPRRETKVMSPSMSRVARQQQRIVRQDRSTSYIENLQQTRARTRAKTSNTEYTHPLTPLGHNTTPPAHLFQSPAPSLAGPIVASPRTCPRPGNEPDTHLEAHSAATRNPGIPGQGRVRAGERRTRLP
ncbi:hypothetical protein JHW43_005343 [Diplocarpon mali]|nr:hypothetical protein JHW43_005343 [Diplocarpon mali]